MNVKGLKEYLSALSDQDQDILVVVPGYEGGVTESLEPEIVELALNVNEQVYYGEHEIIDHVKRGAKDAITEKHRVAIAVYIKGVRHQGRTDYL